MELKKTYHTEKTTLQTDSQGRDIVTTESKSFVVKKQQDSFYMTYFENLSGYYRLTSATDIKLLSILCGIAGFDSGVVELSTKTREEICNSLEIVNSQLTRSLKSLQQKDLLCVDKGRVSINPSCFWKGTNETRNKLLKEGLEVRIRFCSDCD